MEGAVRSGRATATRVVAWLKGEEVDVGVEGTGGSQWSPYESIVETNGIWWWVFVIGVAVTAFMFQNQFI